MAVLCIAGASMPAQASMTFCNRTSGAIETAYAYRGETGDRKEVWVSEGWWRIDAGQCARISINPLSQRFYFYYGRALSRADKDSELKEWAGKNVFCTDGKAFRIEGDKDCAARGYRATGFLEVDIGAKTKDYSVDFKDSLGGSKVSEKPL